MRRLPIPFRPQEVSSQGSVLEGLRVPLMGALVRHVIDARLREVCRHESRPTKPLGRLLGACDKPVLEYLLQTTLITSSSANEAGYVISGVKQSGIGLNTPTALFSRNVPQRWKETVARVHMIFAST